ncbi:hypothetical protein G9A89_023020 [Geosiphon pyriformis]|nr:hypothetical protein G9A89_023020 [Geosiphon pyriformis]
MFLWDSIGNTKSTEPFWFKVIRALCAATFSLGFVSFAWAVLSGFGESLYIPNVVNSETFGPVNYPGFKICRKQIINDQIQQSSTEFNITCTKYEFDTLGNEANDKTCSSQYFERKNSCWKFIPPFNDTLLNKPNMTSPMMTPKDYIVFSISSFQNSSNSTSKDQDSTSSTDNFYELILDSFYIDRENIFVMHNISQPFEIFTSPFDIQHNLLKFLPGEWVDLEYSAIIHKTYYSSHLQGQLGVRADKTWLELLTDERRMPYSDRSKVILFLRPKTHYVRYQVEKYEGDVLSSISTLGGFYSATAGIFVLLFGSSKFAPWGIAQKYIFRCWFFRRSFKEHLARRYISAAGIPFGESIADRPAGATLEARVQILETLLEDYYIETYYLDRLKPTRERYLEQERRHTNLENLNELQSLTADAS